MNRQHLPRLRTKLRHVAGWLLQLAVAGMALSSALPLRAADDHAEREVKQRVAPVYPELAKRMHVSGSVVISATVEPNGTVSATKTISGNRMLSGAAEEAVHKWKFVSAPDESTVEVQVNFALAE